MTAGRINQVGTRFILPVDSLRSFTPWFFVVRSFNQWRTDSQLPSVAISGSSEIWKLRLRDDTAERSKARFVGELRRRRLG